MSLKRKNILIFPAGSEIGFEIYQSLRYNMHVCVFGASGKDDHARFLYPPERYITDNFYIDQINFVEKFNALLLTWNVDFIYPTHDSVALELAKIQHLLSAKVIGSPLETVHIARSKKATYNCFKEYDFCPKVFGLSNQLTEFPMFLKPDDGQGGKGTFIVENIIELNQIIAKNPDLLLTEFLPGEELSVDCFTDRTGKLRFVGPRTRERVTVGISYESESVNLSPEIEEIANAINEKLKFRGAWFFQIKKDENDCWKLLEFASRQASTMGLYRQNGVNFALLSLFDAMGYDINILDNRIPIRLSRRLHNIYMLDFFWDTVFIDFDDTIIVEDRVNIKAISFLYECKNVKKKIVLLTKHRYNLKETLAKYSISELLFDEIIHISEAQEKSDFINEPHAIFIDNYFFDREKVAQKGIPVFDVDALDGLLGE